MKKNPLAILKKGLSVKQYGSKPVGNLLDTDILARMYNGISTQSLAFDIAIGRPGIPLGRITEIVGLEGSSKSTMLYHLLAETQRVGGVAILQEAEHKLDVDRAKSLGLVPQELVIQQPEHLEQSFDLAQDSIKLLRKEFSLDVPIVIGLDSLAGIKTELEVKGKLSDKLHYGQHAAILSQVLRKFVYFLAEQRVGYVFLNQLRDNIGKGFGEDDFKSFGGNSLRYHASLRFQMKAYSRVYEDEDKRTDPIGIKVRALNIKNDLNNPFRKAEFEMLFQSGIDMYLDLKECAKLLGKLKFNPNSKLWKWGCKGEKFKTKFNMKDWESFIESRGGAHAFRKELVLTALVKGRLKPYEDQKRGLNKRLKELRKRKQLKKNGW